MKHLFHVGPPLKFFALQTQHLTAALFFSLRAVFSTHHPENIEVRMPGYFHPIHTKRRSKRFDSVPGQFQSTAHHLPPPDAKNRQTSRR